MMDEYLMGTVEKIIDKIIVNVSSSLSTPLSLSCLIYLTFISYNVIYDRFSTTLWEFIITCVKLVTIITLTTHAPKCNAWSKDIFFTDLPNAIANVTQGVAADKNVWDNIIRNAAVHAFDEANKYIDLTEVNLFLVNWIVAFLCLAIVNCFCIIGFIVSISAKICLFLVLSGAPLFISLYMFLTTRRFAEAWLGQAVNFVILQVLVVLFGNLSVNLATQIFTNNIENIIVFALKCLVISMCGIYFFKNLATITSAVVSSGANLIGAGHLVHHSTKAAGSVTIYSQILILVSRQNLFVLSLAFSFLSITQYYNLISFTFDQKLILKLLSVLLM